jgi:hypothetical protein
MTLQFEYVFAGVRSWRGEVQQQSAIDQVPIAITKCREVRVARFGRLSDKGLRYGRNARSGNTHDTNAGRTRCAGDRGDGVLMGCVCGHRVSA